MNFIKLQSIEPILTTRNIRYIDNIIYSVANNNLLKDGKILKKDCHLFDIIEGAEVVVYEKTISIKDKSKKFKLKITYLRTHGNYIILYSDQLYILNIELEIVSSLDVDLVTASSFAKKRYFESCNEFLIGTAGGNVYRISTVGDCKLICKKEYPIVSITNDLVAAGNLVFFINSDEFVDFPEKIVALESFETGINVLTSNNLYRLNGTKYKKIQGMDEIVAICHYEISCEKFFREDFQPEEAVENLLSENIPSVVQLSNVPSISQLCNVPISFDKKDCSKGCKCQDYTLDYIHMVDGLLITNEFEIFNISNKKLMIGNNDEVTDVSFIGSKLVVCTNSGRLRTYTNGNVSISQSHSDSILSINQIEVNNQMYNLTTSRDNSIAISNDEIPIFKLNLGFLVESVFTFKNVVFFSKEQAIYKMSIFQEEIKIEKIIFQDEIDSVSIEKENLYISVGNMITVIDLLSYKIIKTVEIGNRLNMIRFCGNKLLGVKGSDLYIYSLKNMLLEKKIEVSNTISSVDTTKNLIGVTDSLGNLKIYKNYKVQTTVNVSKECLWTAKWSSMALDLVNFPVVSDIAKDCNSNDIIITGGSDGVINFYLDNTEENIKSKIEIESKEKQLKNLISLSIRNKDYKNIISALYIKNDIRIDHFITQIEVVDDQIIGIFAEDIEKSTKILHRMSKRTKNLEIIWKIASGIGISMGKKISTKIDDLYSEFVSIKMFFREML